MPLFSDMAAAMVSSLVPIVNIGSESIVFSPVHEAESGIAGKNVINPIPSILCAGKMMEWLFLLEDAGRIERASKRVLMHDTTRTQDLGGSASTVEKTRAIINAM